MTSLTVLEVVSGPGVNNRYGLSVRGVSAIIFLPRLDHLTSGSCDGSNWINYPDYL